jgi:quinol-cytochrome oxidoreductase complex cytochrome b subunit
LTASTFIDTALARAPMQTSQPQQNSARRIATNPIYTERPSIKMVNAHNKPLKNILSNHLFYYPTPANLTYNWSFGSLIGLFFAFQIVSGILLARHYTPSVDLAFASVERIRTDVHGGSIFRYFHANGASFIFTLLYLHIARNLYYQSYYTRPGLWYTGLVIFILRRGTAFIGYVLPWGQRSFWGATVITSLATAIPGVGEDIAHWVWGGFSIANATLNRFYSLHYLLPFLIVGLVATHLTRLHTSGSSDPLSLAGTPDKVSFHPYFSLKDSFILCVVLSLFGLVLFFLPNVRGHADNFLEANPLVTPAHIVPEWYFTPFYAILRACPNKGGGALGRAAGLLILFAVPSLVGGANRNRVIFGAHSTLHKVFFWLFIAVFFALFFLGSRPAAEPYVLASKAITILYFTYFIIVLPGLARLGSYLGTTK